MTLLILLLVLSISGVTSQSVEFERDRAMFMLAKVSSDVEKNFYDPELRGLNWSDLKVQARQRIEGANSIGDIYTALFALVDQLQDSHTKFLPPRRAARIRFGFQAKPFGEKVLIFQVTKKGVAEAAGLKNGDQLVAVNGFRVERNTYDEMMLFLRVLRPVTVMELLVASGNDPPRKVRLEAEVHPEAIVEDLTNLDNIYKLIREAQMERESPSYINFKKEGIVSMRLPNFAFSPDSVPTLIDKLEKARAVVLDLRDNSGGRVDTLAEFAGHFQKEKTVMAQIVRRDKTEPIEVKPKKPYLSVPVFILIDSESSSAAEMLARHFQRTGRGVVIGDRSSGRVNASRFFPGHVGTDTAVLYGVQIAVGRVVFPDGEELEKRGVTPDHSCIPTGEDLLKGRELCWGRAMNMAVDSVQKQTSSPEQ